jgi:hypothetical protein
MLCTNVVSITVALPNLVSPKIEICRKILFSKNKKIKIIEVSDSPLNFNLAHFRWFVKYDMYIYRLYITSPGLPITKGISGQTVPSGRAGPGPVVYKRRPKALGFSFLRNTMIHEWRRPPRRVRRRQLPKSARRRRTHNRWSRWPWLPDLNARWRRFLDPE